MEHHFPPHWTVDAVDKDSLYLTGGDAKKTIDGLIALERRAIIIIGDSRFHFIRVVAGGAGSLPTPDITMEQAGSGLRVFHGGTPLPDFPAIRSTIREQFVERADTEILGHSVRFGVHSEKELRQLDL